MEKPAEEVTQKVAFFREQKGSVQKKEEDLKQICRSTREAVLEWFLSEFDGGLLSEVEHLTLDEVIASFFRKLQPVSKLKDIPQSDKQKTVCRLMEWFNDSFSLCVEWIGDEGKSAGRKGLLRKCRHVASLLVEALSSNSALFHSSRFFSELCKQLEHLF